MKKHGIIILIIVLILTLCACGKSKKVQEVDDLIAAIGEISLNSSAAVEAAENAVAELSNRQRNQLENREILESARSTLSDLQYIESHPFEYQIPLNFTWGMSLKEAEKFGFDLSPTIVADRLGFTIDGTALGFNENEASITCAFDFGENNDNLKLVNLMIELSEEDIITTDALWTIMQFYYKNVSENAEVAESTASCFWETDKSSIELNCMLANSGMFIVTYRPLT